MVKVSRPDEEKYWANFSSSGKIAWKTGTSFGNRDAWAVGITPDYVVGIWAGNNDGSGRTGLTGISAAAPVLFDIFNTLQPVRSEWFSMPAEDMSEVEVCAVTGYLAGSNCDEHKKISVKNIAYKNLTCPYHHLIHLDSSGRFRVNADCHDAGTIRSQSWFVLPPSVEKYYLIQNPGYRTLPSLRNDCSNTFLSADEMVVNYPRPKAVISLPELTEGNRGSLVFEAAHSNLSATVFWHIDEQYAGKTTVQHQLSVSPEPGKHKLILIDDAGNKVEQEFEITGT
jgi:penicillin-binding protein 1C